MKKKILILISGFTHGGTNKSLVNFLGVSDFEKYDIEVFSLYNDQGPYKDILSKYNVLDEKIIFPKVFHLKKHKKYKSKFINLYYRFVVLYTKAGIHLFRKRFFSYIGKNLSEKGYDVVIAFQEGFTTELSTYIDAKLHIAWVRCDYSRYIEMCKRDETQVYEKVDYIIAVSNYTAKVMQKYIPSCKDKIKGIHNIIDCEHIISQSEENITDVCFDDDVFNIVSIGRMDPVKRFSYIPEISAELKRRGVVFKWFIIGDGGLEKNSIRQGVSKYNLHEEVVLLGAKENPYPYIKKSSVLVTLSSSEACPNVVNEAKILHVPVVSTNFPVAKEYLENDFNGIICPIEKIADKLCDIYFDKHLFDELKRNVRDFEYDNNEIRDSIEKIINS